MSNSKFASVKIVFENDVRRVAPPNSFSALRLLIIDSFPVLANVAFTVKYLDDENELITALSDNDLVEAYRVSPENKIPKFIVSIAAAPAPVPAPAPAPAPAALSAAASASSAPSSISAPAAPAPETPAASARGSAPPLVIPSHGEIFALVQEFLCGAYTQANRALDELPTLVNVLLSESTLAAGTTVRSVVDTTLAASQVIREHPVVQRLLPLVDHERVQACGSRLLAHLQAQVASGQLAALRERVLALLTQLPMLIGMLPFLLPAFLSQFQNQGWDGLFSGFPSSPQSAAAFASSACSQAASACSQAAEAASTAADAAAEAFSRAFGAEDGNESEDEAVRDARTESLNEMTLQQLKAALAARGISTEGMIEKPELVERLRQALVNEEHRPSAGAASPAAGENVVHHGVACDGCNTQPILGVRWKCSVCPNFDLCAACEARGAHTPTGHPLVKIAVPARPQPGPWGHRPWGRGRGGWRNLFNPHHAAQFQGQCGPDLFHRGPPPPHHHHGGPAPWLHPFQQFASFMGRGRSHSPHQHHQWRRPSPQPSSSPSAPTTPRATGAPQASFVRDVTLPDRTPVGLGKTLIKTWLVQNTGSTPWPATSKLIFLRGDRDLSVEEEFPVPCPVAPGATVEVSAVLRTPQQGGRYQVTFHLADGERNTFGPRLWADLLVERDPEAKPAVEPAVETKPAETAPVVPPAGAAAAAVPEGRHSAQLAELEAMGFGLEPASLLAMLEAHDGSVPAVLSGLLGQ